MGKGKKKIKAFAKKLEDNKQFVFSVKKDYRVEKILYIAGEFYLVKWKGYSIKDSSWEQKENLNCPKLIKDCEKMKEIYGEDFTFFKEKDAHTSKLKIKSVVGYQMENQKGSNCPVPRYLVKLKGFPGKLIVKEPIKTCPKNLSMMFEKTLKEGHRELNELDDFEIF